MSDRPGSSGEAARRVNWSAARTTALDDESLLADLVATFLEEVPGTVDEIARAIAGGNARDLRLNAHKLKGALRIFEPAAALALAQQLEQMGEHGSFDAVADTFAILRRELEPVLAEMRNYLGSPS